MVAVIAVTLKADNAKTKKPVRSAFQQRQDPVFVQTREFPELPAQRIKSSGDWTPFRSLASRSTQVKKSLLDSTAYWRCCWCACHQLSHYCNRSAEQSRGGIAFSRYYETDVARSASSRCSSSS